MRFVNTSRLILCSLWLGAAVFFSAVVAPSAFGVLRSFNLVNASQIAGDIVAHLFASTTGTDSDWVVKVIDVYPEDYPPDPKMAGFELMIADEILRGRFRNSFIKPEPIPANQVVPYTIDLHTNNHAFLKGHRIMVQVHSTWFPVYDRNPQKYVPNIFLARDSDYIPATQKVFGNSRYPSHVTIPTVR